MTFLELQNEVLSDRFSEAKRASAQRWINAAYGRMWDADLWTFKLQVTDLAADYNTNSASLGNIGVIHGIWDAGDISAGGRYAINAPLRPEDFYTTYREANLRPFNYTVVNGTIYFDNKLDQNRSYHVLSEIPFTELTADGQSPLIPSQYHLALAEGAAAIGYRREADPSAEQAEASFKQGIEDMRRGYLASVRPYEDHFPDWP